MKLESRFQTLLVNLYNAAKQAKIIHEENERRRLAREEEWKRWEIEQQKRKLYAKREEIVKNFEHKWSNIKKFKSLHSALLSRLETMDLDSDKTEKIKFILNWLKDFIENNDPMNQLDSLVDSFWPELNSEYA